LQKKKKKKKKKKKPFNHHDQGHKTTNLELITEASLREQEEKAQDEQTGRIVG